MNLVQALTSRFTPETLPKNFLFRLGEHVFTVTGIDEDKLYYQTPSGSVTSLHRNNNLEISIVGVDILKKGGLLPRHTYILYVELL